MKSLWRRLESKFPYGISSPSSHELTSLIYVGCATLGLGLLVFGLLSSVSVLAGLVALGLILPSGAFATFLLSKLFARRHQKVGPFFRSEMQMIESSLATAKQRLKKHGLSSSSEPGLLLEEARQFFSQTVLAAAQAHQDLLKFERFYDIYFKNVNWSLAYEGKVVRSRPVKGIPGEMVLETAQILHALSPLKDFMGAFNSSLESALEQSSGKTSHQDLSLASNAFKGRLDDISERTKYDKAARRDLDRMFEEDARTAKNSAGEVAASKLPTLKKQLSSPSGKQALRNKPSGSNL